MIQLSTYLFDANWAIPEKSKNFKKMLSPFSAAYYFLIDFSKILQFFHAANPIYLTSLETESMELSVHTTA